MAEDKKKKLGLHKQISSIFEGVPLPQSGSLQQPPPAPGGPAPDQPPAAPQRPLPPPFQTLRVPQIQRGYEAGQHKADTAPKAAGPGLWQRLKDKLFEPKPGVSATRQKVMLVLVPLLLVVLIFVATMVLTPPRKAPRPPQAKPPTTVVSTDTQIDWQVPQLYPADLRDPMQLVSVATVPGKVEPETTEVEIVTPQKLIVKGILYSQDNPSAIIGTQIVHQGDTVSGATVVTISKDGVEFEMEGKKWKQGVEP